MKKLPFTTEQKKELSQNKYIQKTINCNIVFTPEFKLYAIRQQKLGCVSRLIFKEAGIPDWINNIEYARSCLKRWSNIYKKKQSFALRKEIKKTSKRNKSKSLSQMSNSELKAKISYLEEENNFLKKLKALEIL